MRFRDGYWFLSNMYPCDVTVEVGTGPLTFRCAEAAFQAAKDPLRAGEFTTLDGFAAKKLGRKVVLRPDWEDIKDRWMGIVLRAKFSDPTLAAQLMAVNEPIQEDNTW